MDDVHYPCRLRKALWLRLIEGDVDDDVWLWVDGDEEWLRSEEPGWHSLYDWRLVGEDWVNAESALRRRVAQRRYPPATARNQKVRSATPGQRLCAIAWLIASSKEVAELFASHGCTPPTLSSSLIAFTLEPIIGKYWEEFPSQTGAWENAIAKAKGDGCICSPADCPGMEEWFDVVVWLEEKPPILEVGYQSCERCRSFVRSRYEDITTEHTAILHVSLLDAFHDSFPYFYDLQCAVRLPSPTAKRMAEGILEPLMKEHGLDMRYLPCVNKYPQPLRERVAELICSPDNNSESELAKLQFPDNIFDGAHDPWKVLGIVALMACDQSDCKNTERHDQDWHKTFSFILRHSRECFDMPALPQLSSTSVRLCRELDRDYSEDLFFTNQSNKDDDSDWVPSDHDDRPLRLSTVVFVAVAMFLRSNDIGFSSCQKCRAICMKSLADASSSAGFEVIESGNDTQGGGMSLSIQRPLEVNIPEPAGMDESTTTLRNRSPLKDEVKLRVVAELFKLRKCLESRGLNASNRFRRSGGDNSPCLEESTLLRHLPANSSSSGLPKSDKVEEIKKKLLYMLGELSLPCKRLPWSTLEQELEKNGYALVNWPTGVRKRGNKGIHDLSAVDVNKLYDAITCTDETRRLHIRCRPSALTVVPVQPIECTSPVASRSKRPAEAHDLHGHPSKRIRFKDMTSKVMQQNLSELRGDGMTGP
ncbi:hypothetical protein BKA82DRAFT_997023 [Pisolithus tinctorius]|uniref:Uncharacterized protein n=1 Tax=Pisolithus tinctorius Marx 270 TaxID=870435 RepID=A0A0C3KGU4_PISTI|nr:hypothetical protein BKA82DRAFT_997023 [Pisolithus tinctorius]KIO08817.1 hypothetical protein M404DRAFT_997023 [Pisolithus tinctorius Marx 270]